MVEKTTLFTVLAKMEKATAKSAVSGFSHVLNHIEAQQRLSMTYDQGREMAWHAQLTENTGVKVTLLIPIAHGNVELTKTLMGYYVSICLKAKN